MRSSLEAEASNALQWLNEHRTTATLEGMVRFAIPSTNALGVAMRDIKTLGRQLGQNQALAATLWKTGVYEARMLASFVGDPAQITSGEMDNWCHDFDNWALCDALSFNLFDRTPFAWAKVDQWSQSEEEFVKRTAFALLWSLSVHDKKASNVAFLRGLSIIPAAATDDRNFVKKAVNMALRAIGKRNRALHTAALAMAADLSSASNTTARWVGKDALKELQSPSVVRRLADK